MNEGSLKSLVAHTVKLPGDAFTYEWGLFGHTVRADVAKLGADGSLHLYEVKGDADNLKRLPLQAAMYSKVANRCGVALGGSYANKLDAVAEIIPWWWDVYLYAPEMTPTKHRLYHYRHGAENPAPDRLYLARLLWKDELGEVLRANAQKGWSSLNVKRRAKLLASLLSTEDLRAAVTPYLLKRTFNS